MKPNPNRNLASYLAAGCLMAASAAYAGVTNVTVVNPERVGLLPRTGTIDVNTNINYGAANTTKWLDITANHNVAVCWSDTGTAATDFKSLNLVWTLYDSNGVKLIPPTVITNRTAAVGDTTLTNTALSYFRPDGTPTPGNVGGVPRIRANRFGDGFLFGGRADRIGLEVPALLAVNTDLSSGGNPITTVSGSSGFPAVQLLNNDGTPGLGIVNGCTDAEAEANGNVWPHGIEYLSNGNIVIVMESRQDTELVARFGGPANDRHVTYRVVTPSGTVVKAYSLVSEKLTRTELYGVGVGVMANGFAIRWSDRTLADAVNKVTGTIRFFDNDGNPLTGDINQAEAVGTYLGLGAGVKSQIGGNGGRGDSVGWHGNGVDAFVNVCIGDQEGVFGQPYVTVYNTDGTVRWHRAVADTGETNYCEQPDAAIAPDGRVVVVMDDRKPAEINDQNNRLIIGRIFDRDGNPMGPCFYVSERENPFTATKDGLRPKVAWRDNLIAVTWGSSNSPAAPSVVSTRFFEVTRVVNPEDVGLQPRHGTVYVNGGSAFNYGNPQFNVPFVDITADHNALVSFGDQSTGAATDFKSMNAVWTLFNDKGNNLISPIVITNRTAAAGAPVLTNNWLAFYRQDGTSTPGNAVNNAKVRANSFGNGVIFGARADRYGLENPAFLAINTDASAGGDPLTTLSTSSGFPAVQMLNNNGSGAGVVSAVTEAEAQATGSILLVGMEYLANGNIVVVSESRQDQELVDRFGGTTPNRHVVYTVMTPAGVVVKPTSLASSTTDRTEAAGFCAGVTSNGFALRFSYRPRHDGSGRTSGTIRLFDNNGNPVSADINQSDVVGAFLGTGPNNPTGGNGGRGDSVGFHGNGKDAYLNVCIGEQEGARGPVFITVYNDDGSVRYHRAVADVGETNRAEQVDGAIAPDGRVLVAIDDQIASADGNSRLILGKMFDPTGKSMGPLFYVSELETPALATQDTLRPRMAWRDSCIAYVWRSLNGPGGTTNVVGYRMFTDVATAPPNLSIAKSGSDAVITWPATAAGYTLRSKASVTDSWDTNSPAPVFGNGGAVYQVTEPIGSSSRIYQLIK